MIKADPLRCLLFDCMRGVSHFVRGGVQPPTPLANTALHKAENTRISSRRQIGLVLAEIIYRLTVRVLMAAVDDNALDDVTGHASDPLRPTLACGNLRWISNRSLQ